MRIPLAFIACVLIWGTTWYAIKLQLGEVPPAWSLAYRFGLASIFLLVLCAVRKSPLALSFQHHKWLLLLGCLLFGINYMFVYYGTSYITSGLVAVIFSLMVVFNIFMSRAFLGDRLQIPMIIGAVGGISGLVLIFWRDLIVGEIDATTRTGILFCIASAFTASLGNMIAANKVIRSMPVMTVNAYAMAYGSMMTALWAFISVGSPTISYSTDWLYGLLYLAVVGSVAAFGIYLWLIDKIGVSAAGYTQVVIPVVALAISTVTEGYVWTLQSVLGLSLIIGGNVIIMQSKRRKKARKPMPAPAP